MNRVGGVLRAALLLWAVPTWSVDTGSSTSPPPPTGALNYSEDLIGQEARHVISAWGAPVRPREDNLNETYDFGNMVVLGSLTFPRQGRLLGWRAYFSRTDLPVDFQIWRAEVGGDPGFLKLVAHTGPVFAAAPGTSVFTLKTLGIQDMYFNTSDLIGLGFESVSPISLSWEEDRGCPMMEGKTEGFLLTCTSHRFRRRSHGCTTYSLQALVDWSATATEDACAVPGGAMVAPSNGAGGGGGGGYPPGADYEMPVYTMPCKEVLMSSKSDSGHLELLNFTHVPPAEDVCLLIILNLGDSGVTSQFALRADITVMDSKMAASGDGECSPLAPLLEFQDGPFMASRVVRSLCVWDPDDHVVTVCERHLRIRMSNRAKFNKLRVQYRVVSKAVTSCQTNSAWFPRSGSRVSAIIAIIVISLLAVIIAIGVTKLAKRGAPLFRERLTSPDGSELFTHDDLMYRTSLTLSSPTSSWPGDNQGQSHSQQGHLLLADGRTAPNSDTTSLGTSERVLTHEFTINDVNTDGFQDDDLLSPLSLTSPRSLTSPLSLTSVTSLTTPTSGPSGVGRSSGGAGVITISQVEAQKWDRIT